MPLHNREGKVCETRAAIADKLALKSSKKFEGTYKRIGKARKNYT